MAPIKSAFNWSSYKINMFRCGLLSFSSVFPFPSSACQNAYVSSPVFDARMLRRAALICDLWATGIVFNFRTRQRPECCVKLCFRFSLIGCCYCCRLIPLTSAVNWNIILIVFHCWIKHNVQHAWPTANSLGVCLCAPTDENQYISIKKENWCPNRMREEKSWSEKMPHTMQKTHMNLYTFSNLHCTWMIDSGVVFNPPNITYATVSFIIIHQVLPSW